MLSLASKPNISQLQIYLEKPMKIELVKTCVYLPYVASHHNPLNKWHYLTQRLQAWIIIKNNRL
jgi:hypothetical protein